MPKQVKVPFGVAGYRRDAKTTKATQKPPQTKKISSNKAENK